jgi:hypothetical protein
LESAQFRATHKFSQCAQCHQRAGGLIVHCRITGLLKQLLLAAHAQCSRYLLQLALWGWGATFVLPIGSSRLIRSSPLGPACQVICEDHHPDHYRRQPYDSAH